MRVKKAGGRIFGGTMSAAEKKAMDLEIQRQLAEYDRKHLIEIDAMILWVLHERFGFGPKRLRQYQMDTGDDVWLCTQMLKRIGVDVEQWHKEVN